MSHFKHIIILVLLAVGFCPTAWAQSTASQPYEGSLHTYTCNGISVGAGYDFYITANADGSGLCDDGLTSEFDILNAKGMVGDDGLATAQIQWNTGASAHPYYVWLEATDPGGCSNRIYIQVSPQLNRFDLLSENIPVDNTMSCPAVAFTDGFNPLATSCDAGTTTLKFIVRRENGTYDWFFEPVLEVDPAYNLAISIVSIVGVNSGTLTADDSKLFTVNGTDNEVTVTVAIQNVPGVSQDVKLSIKNQGESRTNLPDSDASNDVVEHRIEVMPLIEGLQGV